MRLCPPPSTDSPVKVAWRPRADQSPELAFLVIEFVSYEGSFTATTGPALGLPAVDTGSTPAGESLQLRGAGNEAADFFWIGPLPETPGVVNAAAGQTFVA